jgi:hypothetical protein
VTSLGTEFGFGLLHRDLEADVNRNKFGRNLLCNGGARVFVGL